MPRSIDSKKADSLLRVLKAHPQGLWVRELARKAKLDKSTASRYLEKQLKDFVIVEFWGRNKVIKLV